jgi:hypothetical protein
MQHQTERERDDATKRLGWTCVTCQQWWVREPSSLCPGVRVYSTWDDAQAAGLRTRMQWNGERRKVDVAAMPRGAVVRGAAHPSEWYDLYAEDQTTPMRFVSRKSDKHETGEARR